MWTERLLEALYSTFGRDDPAAVPSRYDLVLAVVPLAFLGGGLSSVVAGVPWETGVLGGATVGLIAVADALFVHPPESGRGGSGVA